VLSRPAGAARKREQRGAEISQRQVQEHRSVPANNVTMDGRWAMAAADQQVSE